MPERGKFIALSGPDGAGKSTQILRMADALRTNGIPVLVLRQTSSTKVGEAIREILLGKKNIAITPLAETFLFQAARAQLVAEVIQPALAEGMWVPVIASIFPRSCIKGSPEALNELLLNASANSRAPG